jgi:hypothetical protein
VDGILTGNAELAGVAYRGWFVGHFLGPRAGPASTEAVEVKWGVHPRPESRRAWAASSAATSLSILIQGQIHLFFRNGQEALLSRAGDYALWGPRLAHRWEIELPDTIVLTVRWPSRAGDAVDLDP